jgi:exonuclease VII large subunit
MAAKIISVLSSKYGFDAAEALAYYNDHKNEAGSTTSISTVQRAENAMNKTQAEIDDLKSKIPAKKGKLLENANAKLEKLEEKLADQAKKLEEKKEREAKKTAKAETPKKEAKPKKEPEAPKKEPEAPKKEPKPEDDKRIKRMSPALTKQLTKIFEESGQDFSKEKGQQFSKYVNELSKYDFEGKNLADHMRDFVNSTAPAAKEPEEVEDEDMTEITFKDVKYVVGDISKRVYIANEDEGDQFVGILGLGKFATMKMPA